MSTSQAQILQKLEHHERRFDEVLEALRSGGRRFDQIAQLVEPIPAMQADIAAAKENLAKANEQIAETREIVGAWSAAKNVGKFVKWVGGIIAAVTAMAVSAKWGLAHIFRGG